MKELIIVILTVILAHILSAFANSYWAVGLQVMVIIEALVIQNLSYKLN